MKDACVDRILPEFTQIMDNLINYRERNELIIFSSQVVYSEYIKYRAHFVFELRKQ